MGIVKQRLDDTEKKKKKKLKTKKAEASSDVLFENVKEVNEKKKSATKQKRKREKKSNDEADFGVEIIKENELSTAAEKKKSRTNKTRKNEEKYNAVAGNSEQLDSEAENGFTEHDGNSEQLDSEAENGFTEHDDQGITRNQEISGNSEVQTEAGTLKKSKKKKKKHSVSKTDEKTEEIDQEDAYFISSGDEDCSKGMKKWLTEYHKARPGLKVLLQRIDDFIVDHEEKLEQKRKEREALAAEGGWTVVTHHKGRKKTTDSETGTTVGSVAQAAVEDKMSKKKSKEVGPNFYRFQRRDAQRSEILALREKFEQDKKRIQQLRAARKFRPY